MFGRLVLDKAEFYLYYVDLVRYYKTKRDLLSKKETTELLKNIERFEKSFIDEDVESQRDFLYCKDRTADFTIVTIFELIDIFSLNLKRFVFLANFKDTTREQIFEQIDKSAAEAKKRNTIANGTMAFIMQRLSFKTQTKRNWMYHYHSKITESVKIYESIKKENLNRPSAFFND